MSEPSKLRIVKPETEAEKHTSSTTDTWEFTPAKARAWKLPPFQRPLKVNAKVEALAKEISDNRGVIPGVLTLGVLDKEWWLIDGQHRREAFFMSGCLTGYSDVRVLHFGSMAEMGEEFVNLNSRLVTMKPDDILRGLEDTYPTLARIRKMCSFVGYDNVRRSDKSPVMSMSALLRCWQASVNEVPRGGGQSATSLATTLNMEDAEQAVAFLNCAYTAWGRDLAYSRLWGALNLTICMWLYRRLVITGYSAKTPKLSKEAFTKCLMSLSAATPYVDWLVGRNLSSRDMSPAYSRVKGLFATRIEHDTGKKALLPSPQWAAHTGGRK